MSSDLIPLFSEDPIVEEKNLHALKKLAGHWQADQELYKQRRAERDASFTKALAYMKAVIPALEACGFVAYVNDHVKENPKSGLVSTREISLHLQATDTNSLRSASLHLEEDEGGLICTTWYMSNFPDKPQAKTRPRVFHVDGEVQQFLSWLSTNRLPARFEDPEPTYPAHEDPYVLGMIKKVMQYDPPDVPYSSIDEKLQEETKAS